MGNRILAVIVMGMIGIFTIAMPITLLTGEERSISILASCHPACRMDLDSGGPLPFAGMAIAFILTALIAFTGRVSSVWSRLCFINGLAGLALPFVAIAFSTVFAAHQGSSTGAEVAGAVLGGAMMTGGAAVVGFFVGAIFLTLAFVLRDRYVASLPSAPPIAAAEKRPAEASVIIPAGVSPASMELASPKSIGLERKIPMSVALSALVAFVVVVWILFNV